MSSKNRPGKIPFDATAWMNDHPLFVAWWKNHHKSGFAENRDGRWYWAITPWQAWESERYRAEYLGWSPDPIINDKICEWQAEQREAEEMTARIEAHLGKGFWKLPAHETFGRIGQIYRELENKGEFTAESMRAKIDEAYAYEPGQSAEETELLQRRRDD